MTGRRSVAALLVGLAATAAAIGWLFVLRATPVLGVGPRIPDALPLQRLAGGAAQPLGRFLIAWLPAGIAAGALLVAAGLRRRVSRAALTFAVSFTVLLVLGAAADALVVNGPIGAQLAQQPARAAIWLGAALLAAGAAIPRARAGR